MSCQQLASCNYFFILFYFANYCYLTQICKWVKECGKTVYYNLLCLSILFYCFQGKSVYHKIKNSMVEQFTNSLLYHSKKQYVRTENSIINCSIILFSIISLRYFVLVFRHVLIYCGFQSLYSSRKIVKKSADMKK